MIFAILVLMLTTFEIRVGSGLIDFNLPLFVVIKKKLPFLEQKMRIKSHLIGNGTKKTITKRTFPC